MNVQDIDPHEIERQVVLALVLEPISEKEGCTTRLKDIDQSLKLQYFQASAVNVGKYFYILAERVKESNGQPRVFFDLALDALNNTRRNIDNDKSINHGLIGLLIPIVLSSLLVDGGGNEVCANVTTVLKNSSKEDSQHNDTFYSRCFSTSRKDIKRIFGEQNVGGDSLYENYKNRLELAKSLEYTGGIIWLEQHLIGLPLLQEMYRIANLHINDGILEAIREAYDAGLKLISYNSPGFVADYAAATAYLLLRDAGPDGNLIK